MLMAKPAPLQPQLGRFIVTTVLAWTEAAQKALDRGFMAAPDCIPDELGTSEFLTRVRRVLEDKHGKWGEDDALTVLTTEYIVTTSSAPAGIKSQHLN